MLLIKHDTNDIRGCHSKRMKENIWHILRGWRRIYDTFSHFGMCSIDAVLALIFFFSPSLGILNRQAKPQLQLQKRQISIEFSNLGLQFLSFITLQSYIMYNACTGTSRTLKKPPFFLCYLAYWESRNPLRDSWIPGVQWFGLNFSCTYIGRRVWEMLRSAGI